MIKLKTYLFNSPLPESAARPPDSDLWPQPFPLLSVQFAPVRLKHIQMSDGRYRRLMPIELERINTFPDNHTKLKDISDTKRAFFMGNALVTEVVTRLGLSLAKAN
jgi:hypothetical protein